MNRAPLSLLTALACLAAALAPDTASAAPAPRPGRTIALFLDISGSMRGDPLRYAKEGAQLFVAMLPPEHEVVIVAFDHRAAASPTYALKENGKRAEALKFIADLRDGGGTDYLKALRAVRLPPGSVSVFLSDGEPNGGPKPVLDFIDKEWKSGPLYTVAVNAAPGAAKDLLARMAAMTDGSHVAIDDSEGTIKALLNLAKLLGHFRTYNPAEKKVSFRASGGVVLIFGFDATPKVEVRPAAPIRAHRAHLPRNEVRLATLDLSAPASITVTAIEAKNAKAHLAAIARNDLPVAELFLPGPRLAKGSEVPASVKLRGSDGALINLAASKHHRCEIEVWQVGKMVQSAAVRVAASGTAFEANLRMPDRVGPALVRVRTIDSSTGLPFTSDLERSVVIIEPPFQGLNIVRSHNLAPVFANTGDYSATLDIHSRDTNPARYRIQLGDLTDGGAVLPLSADRKDISPTNAAPARIVLRADVGNVPAGEYKARLVLEPVDPLVPRPAAITLHLTVREPLSAGKFTIRGLEPGQTAKGRLVLHNASSRPLRNIKLSAAAIKAKGGDVFIKLPKEVALVPANGSLTVDVGVAASPRITEEATRQGKIFLKRIDTHTVPALIEVQLVPEGEGAAGLVVAPAPIKLTARPSSDVSFSIRVKLPAGKSAAESVTAEASLLKNSAGEATDRRPEFRAIKSKLTASSPLKIEGLLISPASRGTYTGTIIICGSASGVRRIPFTLVVE